MPLLPSGSLLSRMRAETVMGATADPSMTSTLLLWTRIAGVTHAPHEHCDPAQWKLPTRELHFGQAS